MTTTIRRVKISFLAAALLAATALGTSTADARSIKWARSGDALTLDPHAQNEGPTTNVNRQIYEPLVERDRSGKLVPTLALSWRITEDPSVWEFKLRQGVKFHNGNAFDADDVIFTFERARQPTSDFKGYVTSVESVAKVDAHTVRIKTKGPNPILVREPDLPADHGQGVVGSEQRRQAAGLQEQGRELRGSQRQRHRPVRAGLARAGREDRVQAQRRLLGPRRGPARDHRAGAQPDQGRCDARRRAALGRGRFRPGRSGAGYRAPQELAQPQRHHRPGEPHHLLRHGRGLAAAAIIRRQGQEPVRRAAGAPGR